MKYYIVENNQPAGPFEVEELVAKGVKATDLVWCEGMSQWTPASEVAEVMAQINGASAAVPPVVPCQPPVFVQPQESAPRYCAQAQEPAPAMPNTWLAVSIVVTLLCCVPFGLVAVIKAARVETLWRNGQYEEAEETSASAKKWTIITFVCGLVFYILYVIYISTMASSILKLYQ